MNPRKTDKKLVKHLMGVKGLELITITKDKIVITVSPKFSPQQGEMLVRDIGHDDFKAVSKDGKNFIILQRF